MKAFIAMCILISLPMSMGLNCYQCTVTNCGDPFDKSASGVAQTGENSTNTYCVKDVALGLVTRYGSTSCIATPTILDSGEFCCQTDLCNGARTNNQMPIILIVGLAVILAKIQ